MSALAVIPELNTHHWTGAAHLVPFQQPDIAYFPDYRAAYVEWLHEVYALRSSQTVNGVAGTMNTFRTYNPSLLDLFDYLGILDHILNPNEPLPHQYHFPDARAMREYRSHLLRQGLSPETIAKRLASIRKWLSLLADQPINTAQPMQAYIQQSELRDAIRIASKIKPPPSGDKPDSPAQTNGCWLKTPQVIDLLASIPRTEDAIRRAVGKRAIEDNPALIGQLILKGKQEYALLVLGFNVGLRRMELQSLTLSMFDITDPMTHKITGLRRKRAKFQDIPAPYYVYDAIKDYVDTFNSFLSEDDPRRIQPDQPLWRQLSRSGKIKKGYHQIMGETGVGRLVERCHTRWRQSLDSAYNRDHDPKPFSCHDMRRSMCLNYYLGKMPPIDIMQITGHKSLDMLLKYIGNIVDHQEINPLLYNCAMR